MWTIRAFRQLFWRRKREIDLQMLWPQCKLLADGNLDLARQAFAVHAFNDSAWIDEYGKDRLIEIIEGMN